MSSTNKTFKMLCLGAGNMVSAIVPTFVDSVEGLEVSAFTPSQTRAKSLMEQIGGTHIEDLSQIQNYDFILLGFKPQQFETVAKEIKGQIREDQLVISLLAGTSLEKIKDLLGTTQVVRLMPNTPAQVGAGASLMAFSSEIFPEWKELGLALLKSLGVGVEVSEEQLNIATPFSGSGPAYFYLLTQLLIEDLEKRGINKEDARKLCEQTFIGAAELLKQSDESVLQLRKNVTSKGGVTHAAVESMLTSGLGETVSTAIDQALKRNSELGQ
jgi:pyrroline-5-carboxylate reductase